MIYLPPPQPVLNKDIRISGDVEIHPTASLAPGVILQAAPDRRIIIGADVCIGMGVIINASEDSIEIGSGAIVGSGVLIIGGCKIGNNACIGTAVTVFQTNIDAMTVVEPGSVLGDASRKVNVTEQSQKPDSSKSPKQKSRKTQQSRVGSDGYYSPKTQAKKAKAKKTDQNANTISTPTAETAETAETTVSPEVKNEKASVVGQVYINQLLVTLFPHNKDFDSKTRKLE